MRQRLAEQRAAAVDAATHGAQLDVERRRDLLVRETFDIAQDDGGAEVRRQLVERGLDVPVEVVVVVDLLREALAHRAPRQAGGEAPQ